MDTMTKYLYAKQFYFESGIEGPGYLAILDDGSFGDFQKEKPSHSEIIDYQHYSIAPGLVDTHIHGFRGFDVMDNSVEALKNISEGLPSCGVTSYLPTTLTASHTLLNEVCQTIGKNARHLDGAKIRGIFLEGPFFNPTHKGAQNPKYMSDPQETLLDEWQTISNGWIKKIAIAPERPNAIPFIRHAKQKNIYVALAHTNATYDDCKKAVEAGANIFVHTYNGMRGLHHREPGVVGAALTLPQVFDELICDGHHVHPVSAKIVLNCCEYHRTVLITDCMRGGGMGDCETFLGEFPVTVQNGTARLKDSGNLAGSVLTLITGVQNVVKWNLATPYEALMMASLIPAKSVGIDNVCGRIAKGYAADFIVLNDKLELQATYLNGKLYFEKTVE